MQKLKFVRTWVDVVDAVGHNDSGGAAGDWTQGDDLLELETASPHHFFTYLVHHQELRIPTNLMISTDVTHP